MTFFSNEVANILQHVAVVLELLAILLVISELKTHEKERKDSNKPSLMPFGFASNPLPNRSGNIRKGVYVAIVAFAMEAYQLLTMYLGA